MRHAQASGRARANAAYVNEQLAVFNAWLQGTGRDGSFRMGIGINSGPVMSGSVGSPRRLDYAVIGDTETAALVGPATDRSTGYAYRGSTPARSLLLCSGQKNTDDG